MGLFQIQYRALDNCPDALTAFRRLFLQSKSKFLLESSVVIPGFSRFTFMGDAHGPSGETITYDMGSQQATIERGDTKETVRVSSLFDLLKANLEARKVDAPADLPFGFNLGYAGVFGYELKGETTGSHAWQSDTHDAAFIFATRLVVLDHLEGKTWLLHLTESDAARRQADAWFDAVEFELRSLADTTASASPQVRSFR